MIVGNKGLFAIEFELDDNYGGSWLFGKFCYWVRGVQIGNFALGTSLRDVLFQMKYVVGDCGNRNDINLCAHKPQELFDYLNTILYGDVDTVPPASIPSIEAPARFDIKMQVDVFDHLKIFLIDCSNSSRLLLTNSTDSQVQEFFLPIGEFDNVVKNVYAELNRLYDSEIDAAN